MNHSRIGFKNKIPAGQTFEVFRPRTSLWGWLISVTIAAAMGALAVNTIHVYPRGEGLRWIFSGLFIAFAIAAIFFLSIFPTMKYSVGADTVALSCGPFKWRIPISNICSIKEDDLEYLPWSQGWKLPGYALFRIEYSRIGIVRMCATSLTTRVLLISTGTEKWGITPADVDSFRAAIARGRSG